MNDLVLCTACRHCQPAIQFSAASVYTFARCAISPLVDPVTGASSLYFCSTVRASMLAADCGPHGQFFEPSKVAA